MAQKQQKIEKIASYIFCQKEYTSGKTNTKQKGNFNKHLLLVARCLKICSNSISISWIPLSSFDCIPIIFLNLEIY